MVHFSEIQKQRKNTNGKALFERKSELSSIRYALEEPKQ